MSDLRRLTILSEIRQYFDISELVCPHILKKWKDDSWQFLDTDYLHALLVIRRDILKVPMIGNNALHKQRGMRCNLCDMVKGKKELYLSAHLLGKAGDFTIKGMTISQAIKAIALNEDKLPCNIRIELDVSWLHLDVRSNDKATAKITYFKG